MRQLLGVAILLIFTGALAAQTSNSDQGEYAAAASQSQPAQRLAALERFLAANPQSPLKLDALELLVWNNRTSGSIADLEHWTSQLLATSQDNPLAAAVIIGSSLPIGGHEPPADRAKRAITALDHFDRPEGFSHDDFAAMKNYVVATLNGVVGYSYFEQKEFASARPYLRKAVELLPDNAQFAYTLALSDLQGDKTDQAEGFKYLARAVNLTKNTPAGENLGYFARQKYKDVGGTDEDWNKYLANTVVPGSSAQATPAEVAANAPPRATAANPAPANSRQPTSTAPARVATPAASASTASSSTSAPPVTPSAASSGPVTSPSPSSGSSAAASNSTVTTGSTSNVASAIPPPSAATSAPTTSSAPPAATTQPAKEVAMATPPVPPPAKEPTYRVVPPRRIPELTKGGPLSVGLLIQSSLSQKQTRQPIVFSLTDLVRRLRQNDEAFVMSFSKGLEFEEDLTSNDKALESAMDAISPAQGAAIYDAVTFAAGHLNRIARNRNRVLIVISGEGDRNSGVSPLELSSELNVSGVRIYCIGLDVYSQNDQARLQQLAGYTGGRAFFLSGPEQLRSALQTISNDLGIAY